MKKKNRILELLLPTLALLHLLFIFIHFASDNNSQNEAATLIPSSSQQTSIYSAASVSIEDTAPQLPKKQSPLLNKNKENKNIELSSKSNPL